MRERIRIIANPISGSGRGRKVARTVVDILRRRGCSVEILETRRAGDARAFAAETRGADVLACIGGDGTINEVVNGMPIENPPPLGVIPCGTANVMAKELGLPRAPEDLARVLTEGREIRWDLGIERVSGRKVLLFGSAGYDAQVVHALHARREGPIRMWHYLLWGLRVLFRDAPPPVSVEVDGRLVTREAAWVQVSNVAEYGGPFVFTPAARADDRAFEVLVLHSRRRRDIPRMYFAATLNYLLGMAYPMSDAEILQGRRVKLQSCPLVPIQLDGDPAGHLPADLEIVPGGIRILAP